MLRELDESLEELEQDGGVRAVVITGEKHFCAGADLRELREKGPEEAEALSGLAQKVFCRIEQSDLPVLAAVSGYALGGGCELALACDMRLAADDARFGQPEISLGLLPGFGGTQRLRRLVGAGKAMEMILTGGIVNAGEAHAIGLVNRVVGDGWLMAEVVALAEIVAKKSGLAVGLAKKLVREEVPFEEGLRRERTAFGKCFSGQDAREGINAFLEKREPVFSALRKVRNAGKGA
jgi:enoyl-CoA hydratase